MPVPPANTSSLSMHFGMAPVCEYIAVNEPADGVEHSLYRARWRPSAAAAACLSIAATQAVSMAGGSAWASWTRRTGNINSFIQNAAVSRTTTYP